jgi:metallo-beta-lactamase family protein
MVGEFEVTFLDAGHILGSASVTVRETKSGKTVAFSGDLGNTPEPLLSPTHWVKEAEVAVMESTYGDEIHEPRDEAEELASIVAQAEKENGTVIIPSFSLQRSQELLYIFDQLKKQKKMKEETPVFLDSPMAIKATQVFRDFPELYNRKLQTQAKTDDPFDFPSLVLCDTIEKSRQIKNLIGPKVIVAGSGMMNGGRVVHHIVSFLGDPKTHLVFVGYQAEGTLGRKIKDGIEKG